MSVITCRKCGADMVVSQPDRIHTIVDRKVLNWKDYVKFTIKCKKCAISNMLDGSEDDMVYEEIDKLLKELENENLDELDSDIEIVDN
jgi:hypothetical protein